MPPVSARCHDRCGHWGWGRGLEMVGPWWFVIVFGSCGLDFDFVVENGDKNTLRTVTVYHVGMSNKFGRKDNQLTSDPDSWEHPGCSWISRIAGKSLSHMIWCSEKSDYYMPNLLSIPLLFSISNRRIYRLDINTYLLGRGLKLVTKTWVSCTP